MASSRRQRTRARDGLAERFFLFRERPPELTWTPGKEQTLTCVAYRKSMFDITFDRHQSLVDATLSGFLALPEVARYAGKVEPIIRRAALVNGSYLMLIDVSGCSIQSQQVVAAFQQHVGGVPRARRCAVVTGSSIIRMQIRRIIGKGSTMRIFGDRGDATTWLIGTERQAEAKDAADPCPGHPSRERDPRLGTKIGRER